MHIYRFIVHIIIYNTYTRIRFRRIYIERPSQTVLLHSKALEKANHSTIAQHFDGALTTSWPTGIRHNKVLFF